MPATPTQAIRTVLVDIDAELEAALHSALARIGAQVVASLHGDHAIDVAVSALPGLLIVGPSTTADAQRDRCRALGTRITAPLVAIIRDAERDGVAFANEPSVTATLVAGVGIAAMVGQLPVVMSRWSAWAEQSLVGPLKVDRAEHTIKLWGMAMKVSPGASDALARYADRRRRDRQTGPLPRIDRNAGSGERTPSGPLARVERITGPLPSVERLTGPLARIVRVSAPRARSGHRPNPHRPIDPDEPRGPRRPMARFSQTVHSNEPLNSLH